MNKEELKRFYNSLNAKFEGYIQMSDRRIEDKYIFSTPSNLPKWEELHQGNFIVELVLFDKESNRSILVRQANDTWIVIDKKLNGNEDIEKFYTLKENLKMKIAQIWETEKDEFCLDMEVLEPKYLLFAGFEKDEK